MLTGQMDTGQMTGQTDKTDADWPDGHKADADWPDGHTDADWPDGHKTDADCLLTLLVHQIF